MGYRHQKEKGFQMDWINYSLKLNIEWIYDTDNISRCIHGCTHFYQKTLSVKIIPSKQAQYWLSFL